MEEIKDIAIIGGGPAGMSAALNGTVRNKNVLLFSNDYRESGLYRAERLDNILGAFGISGAEFLEKSLEQIRQRDVPIIQGRIISILQNGNVFYIGCGSDLYMARAVILASGIVISAAYPGERELLGKGVSYCATCDGMLYRGKKVAVVAKSPEAVQEANFLQEIGCHVTVITDGRALDGLTEDIPVAEGRKLSIEGTNCVKTLTIDGEPMEVDGIFILRTTIAMQSLLPGIELEDGHIAVNRKMETSISGVWAAGDCTGKPYQVAKAVGEGLIAALSAAEYLDQLDSE